MRSRRALAGMLGAAALLPAACGGSGSTGGGSAGGSAAGSATGGGTVVIGYENNGADPSMVSIAKDYFTKDIGGHVKLQLFDSGPAALAALASGDLQFMCGLGVPPTISAIARGVPLVVVFNQERYTDDAGIVAKTGSGISSLKDLAGKTVAITTGSEASFELPMLLKGAGVDATSVHQKNMSPPEMRSAWTTGAIQAAIVWDPVFDYLRTHGGTVLATDRQLPENASSYNICVANTSYAKKHPKAAAGFVKALGDGVAYVQAHRSDALQIMSKQAGITMQTAQTELQGYQLYTLAEQPTQKVLGKPGQVAQSNTTMSFTNNWQVLHDGGFLDKPAPQNMAQYVEPSYAADATGHS